MDDILLPALMRGFIVLFFYGKLKKESDKSIDLLQNDILANFLKFWSFRPFRLIQRGFFDESFCSMIFIFEKFSPKRSYEIQTSHRT